MPSAFQTTSISLLQRARTNDQLAWQQLVHLYGPLVYRWCRRASLREADIEDVFQDTFRAVSTNLATFKPSRTTGSFRSWLRTIVRTKVVDHHRKLNHQPVGQGGTDAQRRLSNVVDPLADDEENEAAMDNSLIIQRATDLIQPEFSKRNWQAFQRVAIQGQMPSEVAEDLGVTPQAVRQANYRIRRRLRIVLNDLIE